MFKPFGGPLLCVALLAGCGVVAEMEEPGSGRADTRLMPTRYGFNSVKGHPSGLLVVTSAQKGAAAPLPVDGSVQLFTQDGQLRAEYPFQSYLDDAEVLDDGTIVVTEDAQVTFINTHAKPLAKVPRWGVYGSGVLVLGRDSVLFEAKGVVVAVDTRGHELWRDLQLKPYSLVVARDGETVAVMGTRSVYEKPVGQERRTYALFVNGRTGKTLREIRVTAECTPAATDRLYLVCNDGRVMEFDAEAKLLRTRWLGQRRLNLNIQHGAVFRQHDPLDRDNAIVVATDGALVFLRDDGTVREAPTFVGDHEKPDHMNGDHDHVELLASGNILVQGDERGMPSFVTVAPDGTVRSRTRPADLHHVAQGAGPPVAAFPWESDSGARLLSFDANGRLARIVRPFVGSWLGRPVWLSPTKMAYTAGPGRLGIGWLILAELS
jgi:hypothetical protein